MYPVKRHAEQGKEDSQLEEDGVNEDAGGLPVEDSHHCQHHRCGQNDHCSQAEIKLIEDDTTNNSK